MDQFDYPRKGKNIPPPRELMGYQQMEGDMGDGQDYGDGPQMQMQEDGGMMMEGQQELQLYDENGQPQKFFDE